MEQGPESQRASWNGSGGVSAVIGASDLIDTSVASLAKGSNQFNCALQLGVELAENEVNVPVGGLTRSTSSNATAGVSGRFASGSLSDRIGLRQGPRRWPLTSAQLRVW